MRRFKEEAEEPPSPPPSLPPSLSVPPLKHVKLGPPDLAPVGDLKPVDPGGRRAHPCREALELGQRPRRGALRHALDAALGGVPDPADEDGALVPAGFRFRLFVDLVGFVRQVLTEVDALDLTEDLEVEGGEGGGRRRRSSSRVGGSGSGSSGGGGGRGRWGRSHRVRRSRGQEEQEGRRGDPAREREEHGPTTNRAAAGEERRRRRERASSDDDGTHGTRSRARATKSEKVKSEREQRT